MLTNPTVLIIPDSFKGSLTAVEVCNILDAAIQYVYTNATTVLLPASDGGEGFCDAFFNVINATSTSAKKPVEIVKCNVRNPLNENIDAQYFLFTNSENEKVAFIESAGAVGLMLVGINKNPLTATSYGLGEMLKDALNKNCSKIIVGLGGSSTNDCGAGMLSALGVKFFDDADNIFIPTGGNLSKVARLDISDFVKLKLNAQCKITAICDVENPLCGVHGASMIYAPQKGASDAECVFLDSQLQMFSDFLQSELPKYGLNPIPSITKGAGAAGGLSYALCSFLDAELKSGVDAFLDFASFDELVQKVDIILTGEGSIDEQTINGKLIHGILRRVNKRKPVIGFAGKISGDLNKLKAIGLTEAICINDHTNDIDYAIKHAKDNLYNAAKNFFMNSVAL